MTPEERAEALVRQNNGFAGWAYKGRENNAISDIAAAIKSALIAEMELMRQQVREIAPPSLQRSREFLDGFEIAKAYAADAIRVRSEKPSG